MARTSGRGRLSSIDQLPDEAGPYVTAAIEALKDTKLSQNEIREELNVHLERLDCKPISRSAFNRYSLHMAQQGQRLIEARNIAAIFAEKINEQPEGDIGLLVGETLKTLIYDVTIDMTLDGESPSIKMLAEAAKALKDIELGRGANYRAAKLRQDNFIEEAADTAEEAARERGLSEEAANDIRAKVLGVRTS